jgi:ankyrin repeat protein
MGSQPKEALYQAVVTHDHTLAQQILAVNPALACETLTRDCKSTAIGKAASLNDLRMIRILVLFGGDVNFGGERGMTPIMWAALKNHVAIARALVESFRCDLGLLSRDKLNALDYAVLYGSYETALYLWGKVAPSHSPEDYELIMRGLKCAALNYTLMLDCLRRGVQQPPRLVIDRREDFDDPVVDPRESWGEWARRVSEFRDPPFVERRELPQHLRP